MTSATFDWNGGENNYDGPHDDFCFVCGGTLELIGCQTCENCYHVDCMTLSPESTPTLWFCPNCTDRDWHVPPDLSLTAAVNPSPQSIETIGQSTKSNPIVRRAETSSLYDPSAIEQASSKRKFTNNIDRALHKPKPVAEKLKALQHPAPAISPSRPQKSHSAPRKKSKYSSFSSEVDKALVVIHKELEFAAGLHKSEDALQIKIQALEQELKLKDGQMKLFERELELAKTCETGSGRLKDENEKLRVEIEMRDKELIDWRMKLRRKLGEEVGG